MQILKTCEVCGNQFVADRRNAKYCSKPCRKIANNESLDKYLRAKAAAEEARKKKAKTKQMPLWQVNEAARKAGLTYGQYQAMLYKARQLDSVSVGS